MLKRKDEQPSKAADSVNLIGAGTIIKGDIECAGDIRIDGNLEGSVRTKGKLVVGNTGVVDGDIYSNNADISGTINGTITVAELLSLKISARLKGDITTTRLAIEPGAEFTGSCSMGGVVKDIKNGESTGSQLKEKTA